MRGSVKIICNILTSNIKNEFYRVVFVKCREYFTKYKSYFFNRWRE